MVRRKIEIKTALYVKKVMISSQKLKTARILSIERFILVYCFPV